MNVGTGCNMQRQVEILRQPGSVNIYFQTNFLVEEIQNLQGSIFSIDESLAVYSAFMQTTQVFDAAVIYHGMQCSFCQ
jgi:hypothetical protein